MARLQDGEIAQQDVAAVHQPDRLVGAAQRGLFLGVAQQQLPGRDAERLGRLPSLAPVPVRARSLAVEPQPVQQDRKSVGWGKRVSLRVALGGLGILKKKKNDTT